MRPHIAALVVAFLVSGIAAASSQQGAGEITITILYDNTVSAQGTRAAWGFSCFIQSETDTILYDGGGQDSILLGNAEALGIDLSSTKRVFLSHPHWDHAGGLAGAIARTPGVPVYVGASFPPSIVETIMRDGGKPVPVTGPVELSKGFSSTGEFSSKIGITEQALVVDTDSGLVLVVGCSHPGIVEMLRAVKKETGKEIFAVFGGFHLLQFTESQVEGLLKDLRNLGVRKCGATHCTGEGPIRWISKAYGGDFLPMGVGRVLHFPGFTGSTHNRGR